MTHEGESHNSSAPGAAACGGGWWQHKSGWSFECRGVAPGSEEGRRRVAIVISLLDLMYKEMFNYIWLQCVVYGKCAS